MRREIFISKSIGLALLLEVNLLFLLCFILYFRAIFQVKAPGGLIFGGAILRRVFCVTSLGGLYLEGLIHRGAYFRNFTVFYYYQFFPNISERFNAQVSSQVECYEIL